MRTLPLLWVLGCGGGGADSGAVCPLETDGARPTWANFGEGFFQSYCQPCHAADSPNRFGAPEGTAFGSEAEVIALEARIRARVLEEGTMPPGGGVLEEDLVALAGYLACLEEAR